MSNNSVVELLSVFEGQLLKMSDNPTAVAKGKVLKHKVVVVNVVHFHTRQPVRIVIAITSKVVTTTDGDNHACS